MYNSFLLTLCGVLLAPLIFSQSISVNGLNLNQTTGACDPSTFQIVGTASVNSTCIQLNEVGNFKQGGFWACNTISLDQSFKLNFKANFGSDQTTGDGIAFVLQEEGLGIIGGTGGGMGYANGNPINCVGGACPIEPSVVVEFDTYNGSAFGDNDVPCNHTSIQTNGSTLSFSTISGPECLLPSGVSIVDGNEHDICITWNPFALQYRVYFDDALLTSYNGDIRSFFTSPSSVYWGCTASSGGATQVHSVCEIEMLTSIPNPTCICNTPNLMVTDPPAFCGTGNITDPSITAGSEAGTITYWNNASCTNALTNPNVLVNSGVFYIQLETTPGCTLSEAVNLTVNNIVAPEFDIISHICEGEMIDLPTISLNGVNGSWSPATNNMSTTTYTFTPDPDECATEVEVDIIVRPAPTIEPISDVIICSGDNINFNATIAGIGTSINWSSSGGSFSNPTQASTTFIPNFTTGNTTVTAVVASPICSLTNQETINITINTANTVPIFMPISDICSGDALSLPAASTNAISGSWSPAVDNTTTTTYTFTPDGGQCATSQDLTVNVNAIPQFNNSVLSDPTFCSGSDGSILIDGLNTSSTYDLSYNDGVSNIGPFSITTDASGEALLTGLEAGTYSSFMIADGNCSFTVVSPVNLTDPLAPEFAASGFTDPSICGGNDGEIILTGLLSNTPYSLSYIDDGVNIGPLNISSDVSGKIQISNLNAGVYSAFVLDLAGCSGSTPSSITLVDPSVPVLQITDPLAVCTPGTVDLSLADVTAGSTGDGTLTYWIDATATIPLVDPSAVASSGTYYIQSESNGCTDIEAVNVVVNQTPVIQITDPLAVCTPGTVDLSLADVTAGSTGAGTLSYWMDAAATTPLADQSAVASSGTYYIQSENNGCTDIEAVNVVVNQTPSFTVSGTDPSVCNAADGLITLIGLDPSTVYTLSYDSLAMSSQTTSITSDASGSFVLSGFVAGLYDAFSISLNGCAFTAIDNIDLNNPSAPSVDLQLDTTVCDTYTLEVITGSNLSGNEAYYSQSNGVGSVLSPGDAITTSQTVYIYDNIGACSDEASFTLTVNTTPEITNLSTQEACVDYTLPVIEGTNLSGNENYYTDAQVNGGTAITNPITTSQPVFIYDASGTCSDEVSFEVIIYDLPEVLSFSGEGTYCEGDAIDPLNVEVNGVGELTLDYSLDGVNNATTTNTTSIALGSAPGVYILTQITDAHCSNTSALTQTITVNATPATPSTSGDTQYCASEEPQAIEADGSTGSYTWYADQDLTEVIGNEAEYTPENIMGSTSYYVTATENGCEGLPQMLTITFQECGIIIPTAFTPDGDQTNDTWRLENIDAVYPNNVVSIYNRLGNKVFEAQKGSYNQMPWDGTFNGQELPVTSYYYIIEYNDNTTENSNGIVTLIK